LLRKAFNGYLPDDVLWRRKAAFSDAVSSSIKPWYKWIHEYLNHYSFDIQSYGGTKESNYYKTIFYSIYTNYKPTIPLWLPQWIDTGAEPSATALPSYQASEH
jgi:asparagine synthase (glutamine-hydrolysing)